MLFGGKGRTPMVSGQIPVMAMGVPSSEPFQRVSPITQFSPSPVNVPYGGQSVPQMAVPYITPQPMPTMPTQIIPPQYIPQPVQFKRPVGRPKLNRPPKIKRPVGRPKKSESIQMTEMAQ